MKSLMAALFTVAALLCISPLYADTIRVGNYTQPGDYSLVQEGDEILAPALLGLSHLGFNFIVRGKNLTLRSPAGREIALIMDKTTARVDDKEVELKVAPRFVNQRCFLPVRSLAEPLGMAVVWEAEERALTLQPLLTTLEVKEEAEVLRLNLGAQVKLVSSIGRLVEPPRLFIDIANVFAGEGTASDRLEVNSGILLAVRSAPKGGGEAGLRVVADLSRPAQTKVKLLEQGCLLQIEIAKKPATLVTPKSVLQAVRVLRNSPRAVCISLSLSAPAVVDSEMLSREKTLIVRVFDTASRLEGAPEMPENELVAGLELRSAGVSGEVQELRVSLKKEARHLLLAQGKEVQLLVGDFSISGLKIVIDPGHGGSMSGTVGRSGLMEKDVNLDIALRLEGLLRDAGAKVFLTRREDCELCPIPKGRGGPDRAAWRKELALRPGLANGMAADLFISLHCNANAATNPHPRTGTEAYYWTPQSRLLAQTIQAEMVKTLGRKDGGIFGNREFVVIREAKMPSVLVETAYMDNAEEEKLLAAEDFRAQVAKAIFSGLSRYIEIGGPLGCPPARKEAPGPP